MLVAQNKEMAAMLVSQTKPLGIELYFNANTFLCVSKSIWPVVTWMKTLYRFILTILPVPCRLDSSVGRALHRYRRAHGFDSGLKLNFCSGFLFATSAVIFTTATVCHLHNSFTYSPNMQYVQIFTLAVPSWLFWFVGSYLRAAVCKNQTYRSKSGKFDFFHILMLDRLGYN